MLRLLVIGLVALFAACDTSNAPADHTVNENGVFHKPGLQNPTVNCTECHGASLQGGRGPSCTSCHGVKW
ncbi:MAG: hypothetical protein CVU56_21595 [Deltaproteobacteria bacterium HGW-Deltaproteobacteria-14]|nr:MAG: hypothetical protein CVU56_21595 [Deltaproteobacteria bacterium HGW-Deltaproteobacteria-14]